MRARFVLQMDEEHIFFFFNIFRNVYHENEVSSLSLRVGFYWKAKKPKKSERFF
jgi:hypothetical protein